VNIEEFPLDPWRRERIRGIFESPYYRWLGLVPDYVGGGESRVLFRPRRELITPNNTLDGSVINSVLELPSFLALLCELREGELPVTNDIFVQQLRPVPGDAEVVLEGRLNRRGRTMAWTEARASVDGKPTALARITKTLLDPSGQ
jgi:acyl-coenzyme A thioesterase PaaI-like protein